MAFKLPSRPASPSVKSSQSAPASKALPKKAIGSSTNAGYFAGANNHTPGGRLPRLDVHGTHVVRVDKASCWTSNNPKKRGIRNFMVEVEILASNDESLVGKKLSHLEQENLPDKFLGNVRGILAACKGIDVQDLDENDMPEMMIIEDGPEPDQYVAGSVVQVDVFPSAKPEWPNINWSVPQMDEDEHVPQKSIKKPPVKAKRAVEVESDEDVAF